MIKILDCIDIVIINISEYQICPNIQEHKKFVKSYQYEFTVGILLLCSMAKNKLRCFKHNMPYFKLTFYLQSMG